MSAEDVKKKLIHIVMEEAYEEGIEEGKRQALEQIKTLKEQNHKLRMDKDFSHNPSPNIYGGEWSHGEWRQYDAFEGRWKKVGGEDDAT